METEEGKDKSRRSVWWRFQEVKNGGYEVFVRCILIILSITPTYSSSDQSSSSNPVENLIRLKQQLILEHLAGDGETKLQRSIRDNLNRQNKETTRKQPQGITLEGSLTQKEIQEFEQQYKTPENCTIWRNNAHMVKCINHKMRSREEYFESKDSYSNSGDL